MSAAKNNRKNVFEFQPIVGKVAELSSSAAGEVRAEYCKVKNGISEFMDKGDRSTLGRDLARAKVNVDGVELVRGSSGNAEDLFLKETGFISKEEISRAIAGCNQGLLSGLVVFFQKNGVVDGLGSDVEIETVMVGAKYAQAVGQNQFYERNEKSGGVLQVKYHNEQPVFGVSREQGIEDDPDFYYALDRSGNLEIIGGLEVLSDKETVEKFKSGDLRPLAYIKVDSDVTLTPSGDGKVSKDQKVRVSFEAVYDKLNLSEGMLPELTDSSQLLRQAKSMALEAEEKISQESDSPRSGLKSFYRMFSSNSTSSFGSNSFGSNLSSGSDTPKNETDSKFKKAKNNKN